MNENAKDQVGVKLGKTSKPPLYTVTAIQFPDALKEVAIASAAGHQKYEKFDQDWLNYKRAPNTSRDYLEAAQRHLTETGTITYDQDSLDRGFKVRTLAQVAWNALAALQMILEEEHLREMANAPVRYSPSTSTGDCNTNVSNRAPHWLNHKDISGNNLNTSTTSDVEIKYNNDSEL